MPVIINPHGDIQIRADIQPFERNTTDLPDLKIDGTGPPLPSGADLDLHVHKVNTALTMDFQLTGDGGLHLDIQLLVPAVHPTTDFIT